jgi:hypothetical protein
MTVRLYGATSGYVDLDAPAIAGTANVTLPGSGTLALSSQLKVLQIVRTTDTTDRSTTSTSFVDLTGMSVTITPQVSTSAIMVVMTFYASTNASNRSLIVRIADSSNTAISGAQFGNFADTGGSLTVPGVLIAYATPGTVNSTTYKGQFRTGGSNPGTVTIENASMTGQIYAIELAA